MECEKCKIDNLEDMMYFKVDYTEEFETLTNMQGIILCPDCFEEFFLEYNVQVISVNTIYYAYDGRVLIDKSSKSPIFPIFLLIIILITFWINVGIIFIFPSTNMLFHILGILIGLMLIYIYLIRVVRESEFKE